MKPYKDEKGIYIDNMFPLTRESLKTLLLLWFGLDGELHRERMMMIQLHDH